MKDNYDVNDHQIKLLFDTKILNCTFKNRCRGQAMRRNFGKKQNETYINDDQELILKVL